jgi:hypothetical protein
MQPETTLCWLPLVNFVERQGLLSAFTIQQQGMNQAVWRFYVWHGLTPFK